MLYCIVLFYNYAANVDVFPDDLTQFYDIHLDLSNQTGK